MILYFTLRNQISCPYCASYEVISLQKQELQSRSMVVMFYVELDSYNHRAKNASYELVSIEIRSTIEEVLHK